MLKYDFLTIIIKLYLMLIYHSSHLGYYTHLLYQTISDSEPKYFVIYCDQQKININPMIDQETNELEREFGRDEFLKILPELLDGMGIEPRYPPSKIYQDILQKNGRVIGRDLISAVQAQQDISKEQEQLIQQVQFYSQALNDLIQKGYTSITPEEFQTHFIKKNPHKGVLSEEITRKVKHLNHISIEKLQQVVSRISGMREKRKPIKYPSEILDLEKSVIDVDQSMDGTKIAEQLLNYTQSNVIDYGVRENIQKMVGNMQKQLYSIREEQTERMEEEKRLQTLKYSLEEELIQLQTEIVYKTNEIQRLEEKIEKQFEDIQAHLKKERDFISVIAQVETKNDELIKENDRLLAENQQLKTRVEWFQQNHREMTEQFNEYINKTKEEQKLSESENQKKLFIQRTAKEQLEDAHAKITRLRTENSELKQRLGDMEAENELKLHELQEKILQLEACQQTGRISQRYSALIQDSRLNHSRLSKDSESPYRPRRSEFQMKQGASQVSRESCISIALMEEIQSIHKASFKKKQFAIADTISVIFPTDEERQMNKYDQIGICDQKKELSELTDVIGKHSSLKENQLAKGIFSTGAYIVHEAGSHFSAGLIFSSNMMVLLDGKMRYQQTIRFNQIRRIFFCHHNLTWIAIKLHDNMKSAKGQRLVDLVFSLPNRSELLDYLDRHCWNELKEAKTEIKFEKEENIWLRISDKDILLSNFVNFYNLNRLTINNAHNIFDVNIRDGSGFFSTNVLLVVTSVGLLGFERKATNLVQEKPVLLYCLPLVEKMQIIEVANEHKIKILYETEDKSYKIKLLSYAQVLRLKNKIEEQRSQNFQWKMELIQHYPNLNELSKSRKK